MLRRVLCSFGFLFALVCLLGADSITHTVSTPNPMGAANMISGSGNYTVDPANLFDSVYYYGKNTATKQQSAIKANTPGGGAWDGKRALVAGNYDTWGSLTTKDKNGNYIITDSTPVKNDNIKKP